MSDTPEVSHATTPAHSGRQPTGRELAETLGSIGAAALSLASSTATWGPVGAVINLSVMASANARFSRKLTELKANLDALARDKPITDSMLEEVFRVLRESSITFDEEKLELLKNAAVNSVLLDATELDMRKLNGAACRLLPHHVRTLSELLHYQSPQLPQDNAPSPCLAFLRTRYPELSEENIRTLLVDLEREGLIQDDSAGRWGGPPHWSYVEVTEFGHRWLQWLSNHQNTNPP